MLFPAFQPGCRLHPPSVIGVGIAAVGMAAATDGLGFLVTCASFSAASRSATASAAASAAASSLYEPRAAPLRCIPILRDFRSLCASEAAR